jgi:hypothetical protein
MKLDLTDEEKNLVKEFGDEYTREDLRIIKSSIIKQTAEVSAGQIRAKLMGEPYVVPFIMEPLNSMLDKINNALYIPPPPPPPWKLEQQKREEENAKRPEHDLKFIREIPREFGPRWNPRIITHELTDKEKYKKLYQCKTCKKHFNSKNPNERCHGKFENGVDRETPYMKVGQVMNMGNDSWKLLEFTKNKISARVLECCELFASYLEIGQVYDLEEIKHLRSDNYEVWEVNSAQMKREYSQVLLCIINGVPDLDLDS